MAQRKEEDKTINLNEVKSEIERIWNILENLEKSTGIGLRKHSCMSHGFNVLDRRLKFMDSGLREPPIIQLILPNPFRLMCHAPAIEKLSQHMVL